MRAKQKINRVLLVLLLLAFILNNALVSPRVLEDEEEGGEEEEEEEPLDLSGSEKMMEKAELGTPASNSVTTCEVMYYSRNKNGCNSIFGTHADYINAGHKYDYSSSIPDSRDNTAEFTLKFE